MGEAKAVLALALRVAAQRSHSPFALALTVHTHRLLCASLRLLSNGPTIALRRAILPSALRANFAVKECSLHSFVYTNECD